LRWRLPARAAPSQRRVIQIIRIAPHAAAAAWFLL
jgi:hypothetical protein